MKNIVPDINLSKLARHQALGMKKANEEYADKALRLYLEGKGCDGFYYGVSFDAIEPSDFQLDCGDGLILIVDPDTYKFVKGSSIDWIDDERGRGFLVTNPRQDLYRGKFFKRPSWRNHEIRDGRLDPN